ncbi:MULTISPECIES: CerR family C-terminal domain-containing protein [unclassified Janthinobacterium]|uniref:CerR family C-terminal domain-containing protein n=1 Tax=unclassified Janthinobacterium TaxID=2610881 RepID=UPI000881397B|nr:MULTISPECIES: CerR family C-terminal domain-containing protein [unclassified Janthinobacterium]SDA70403.1 transcriptional regulator, TetR family [Janthinobacterium sp. 551a]SFB56464.1 transcriptional regulator, TetR family [Janthinobacterium sp. 344]
MTEEKNSDSEPARVRILQVAADLFADDGYKATSVRKICEAARVNVAMVNYYFHSKEELHLAAFDYARALARASAADVAAASAQAQLPPVEQLRLAIEALVFDMLRAGPASLFSRLVARELIEPTAAIHKLAERNVRPQHALFTGLVRGVVGQAMPAPVVQKCVFSIIGQVVFYARSRIVHELVVPEMTYDEAGIASIAQHIAAFSLAALDGLRREYDDAQVQA